MVTIYKLAPEKIATRRVDPWHYQPKFENQILKVEKVGSASLQYMIDMDRGVAGGATPLGANYLSKGRVRFYRTSEVDNMYLSGSDAVFISDEDDEKLKRSRLEVGDVLLTITGAKFGKSAVVEEEHLPGNISQHSVRFHPLDGVLDPYFLVSYLESKTGQMAIWREAYGATRPAIDFPSIGALVVPKLVFDAQKYIGEKVRQANFLRILIKKMQNQLNQKARNAELDTILLQENVKYGFVTKKHLSIRLDPNYSNKRALKIIKNIDKRSIPLSELANSVSNGYEDRNFVENGLLYVTGTELSSGRLDTEEAPKIEHNIAIPQRVIANEKCVLFVRVGTVGKLGKVSLYDSGCVVSSNVIKVEFESQEVAAAVCAFYQSDAGQVLLEKISFGVIQSQIGQGELLGLPVPNYCLDKKSIFLKLMNLIEESYRNQQNLLKFSKLLVEEVIEGQITEQQLVEAQQALDAGDESLDRALLERMTAMGIDADSDPLFDDIDQLYDLLEQAKQALDADDSMAEA